MTVAAFITRDQIIAETRSWLGTPYHHNASVKGVGTDCLGLVIGVYEALIGQIPENPPPYRPDWSEVSKKETLLLAAQKHLVPTSSAKKGDVLIFRMHPNSIAKHCGILVSKTSMVHAHTNRAVYEIQLNTWWNKLVAGCFSFPGIVHG